MIIKGNPAGSVAFWSSHLLRDDTNERAEVMEIRGLISEDLPNGLREMQAIASGSRSQGNFLYVVSINPGENETLTPDQWTEAVDTLERNLGLEGHQRIVVEHEKHGRVHRHVAWNRVDVDTMKVADMGGNWRVHTATSRELEARFGLAPTPSPATPAADRKPAPELWEIRAAEKSGIPTETVKRDLSEAWAATATGQEFAEAVEARGYMMARGDRRDFVVLDQAGDVHSIARRIDGVRAADVRGRMADLDPATMPSVAEARAEIRSQARADRVPELQGTSAEIRASWTLTDTANGFAAALEDKGLALARVDGDEASASERARAFAKEIGNHAPRYAEGELVVVNSFGGVYRIDERTTGETRQQIDRYLAAIDPASLLNVTDTRDAMKEAARAGFTDERLAAREISPIEQKILDYARDAQSDGAFAAALYRDGITIARADAKGIEQLAADQRTAFADDRLMNVPNLREGELVAVNRFGGVHTLNPQKLDGDAIERALTGGNRSIASLSDAREQVSADRDAETLASDRQSAAFWEGYREQKDERDTASHDAWLERAEADRERLDTNPTEAALEVVSSAGDAIGKLADFVADLFAGGSRPPAPDRTTFDGARQERDAQRRALVAMEKIKDSMEAGEGLKSEDVANLHPSQLENIRARGDDALRAMIESMERQRERERDYGRARER